MPDPHAPLDLAAALAKATAARDAGQLSASAWENLRRWLIEPRYREYAADVASLIQAQAWRELDDAFWTVIPFGTGGRRGKMFPVGSNAINDRTIGESAQGLASYVKDQYPPGSPLACAIAYDTRHRSRHFAELCAEVMVGAGFRVWFLDGYRSTPELSVAVRRKACQCGVMVTASHNPPSDNAVKAYWCTGGQILPPHDQGVIERVMSTETIVRTPFAQGLADGRIVYCQGEVDAAYLAGISDQSRPGSRDLKILYSPMHGVGASSVCPALAAAGFREVEVFAPHAAPDGDFPNVVDHVANPENPRVFDAMITRAKASGADLILATDPDADRLGCAAPVGKTGEWKTFTGNQLGALLTDHLLARSKASGGLSPRAYVVKTLVTTEMIRRIADAYGVATEGDLQVGFKWIAGVIDERGPADFLLGAEESHGYLVGSYARDKDAAVAALLIAELAAETKAKGQTLHDRLDSLSWRHGLHAENTVSKTMPGSQGMDRMRKLMQELRERPPEALAGMRIVQSRDYSTLLAKKPGGTATPLRAEKGDMIILDLEREGNYVAIRPSGTEPKVKFYLFAFEPAELLANLEDSKAELQTRLSTLERELFALADRIT